MVHAFTVYSFQVYTVRPSYFAIYQRGSLVCYYSGSQASCSHYIYSTLI